MPQKYLYPMDTLYNSGFSITGGSTCHEVLDDIHDSEDQATTMISMASSASQRAYGNFQNLTDPVGAITTVDNWGQMYTASGTSWAKVRVGLPGGGAGVYMQVQNDTTATWQRLNYGPTATNPYTSAPWTLADINAACWDCGTGADLGVSRRMSAAHIDIEYVPPSGGFAFLLVSWIPPLLAVASHGLLFREIAQILWSDKYRTHPCFREDYMRIMEAFRRRPVYGYSR